MKAKLDKLITNFDLGDSVKQEELAKQFTDAMQAITEETARMAAIEGINIAIASLEEAQQDTPHTGKEWAEYLKQKKEELL